MLQIRRERERLFRTSTHQCAIMLVNGEPPPPPPRGPGAEAPCPPNRAGLLPTPPGPPAPLGAAGPMPLDSQVLAGPPGAPPRGPPLLPTPPLANSTEEAQERFGADANLNLSGAPPPPPRPGAAAAPADEGSAPPPPPRMLARPAGIDAPSDGAGGGGGGGVPPPPPPRKMSPGALAGGSASSAGEIPSPTLILLLCGENHLSQPPVCVCVFVFVGGYCNSGECTLWQH